jgi:hypothetical protein
VNASTYTVRVFDFRYTTHREMGCGFLFRKPYKTAKRARLAAVEAVWSGEGWAAAEIRENDKKRIARCEVSGPERNTLQWIEPV